MIEPQTLCRDCIFAIYDSNKQVGCKFDRLEKFEQNGGRLIRQEEGGREYLLIDGRVCTTCRNEYWGQKNPKRKWMQIVNKQIEIKLDVVIHVTHDKTFDDVIYTLESAFKQEIRANHIMVVVEPNHPTVDPIDLVNYLLETKETRNKWTIENIRLEIAVKYCNGSYHAIFKAGNDIPLDFIFKINRAINVDLKRFVVLIDDTNDDPQNGIVIQQTKLPLNTLYEMGIKTNTSHMVMRYSEL